MSQVVSTQKAMQDTMPVTHGRDNEERGGDLSVDDDEERGGESTPLEYNILSMPADYTLETLHQKWRNRDIVIPKFQRGYVWKAPQASKLIESFLMGLPVPPVFLATDESEKSVVIDGMQRLVTVFSYLDGAYPINSDFKGKKFEIVGINENSRLCGKTFLDLGEDDQRRLKNAVLRATIVKQNSPTNDNSSMYEIFERLNTGGTSLEAQEIRNGVYMGSLNELLGKLNADKDWRDILGKPRDDPRMKDREMILRYMALFHEEASYAPPMKKFLSNFMARHKNPSDEFLNREEQRFTNVTRAIRNTLGSKPFNNEYGQLRAPLFDSIFVAFAHNSNRRPDDIKERFRRLRGDPEFVKHTGRSTTSAGSVKGRLARAREILFE